MATGRDFNLHMGANATYVIHPADQGQSATGARYAIRFRDRPEVRVDSTRLIDTGSIDADHAYAAGIELAGNWRNWLLQGENFWYGIERRSSTLSTSSFSGYFLQGSWVLNGSAIVIIQRPLPTRRRDPPFPLMARAAGALGNSPYATARQI